MLRMRWSKIAWIRPGWTVAAGLDACATDASSHVGLATIDGTGSSPAQACMFEGRDQHLTAEREILANATLREIEAFAANLLPSYAHDYYASGARDEQTFRGNLAGWGRWWLVPRMLNDVSKVSLETSILGNKISVPLMV